MSDQVLDIIYALEMVGISLGLMVLFLAALILVIKTGRLLKKSLSFTIKNR